MGRLRPHGPAAVWRARNERARRDADTGQVQGRLCRFRARARAQGVHWLHVLQSAGAARACARARSTPLPTALRSGTRSAPCLASELPHVHDLAARHPPGKSMATVRYTYMAQQADVEGETDAASVFRAVGESEDNHAMGHLEFLQDTGDPVANQPITNTLEMLQAAIISENHDASTMYPEFARGTASPI